MVLDASGPEREARFPERMTCPECTGLGSRMEVDAELGVPDEEKSLSEGAVAPWTDTSDAEYFTAITAHDAGRP
ncbi:hypothetical protein OG318_11655 [Streptomyces sp. NBC_01483]